MSFNVNAARAQRIEARGDKWLFEVDSEKFSIPTELKRSTLRRLRDAKGEDLDELLKILLGEGQAARLDKHDLSAQDIAAIMKAYGADTGASVGEDSGSAS